MSSIHLPSFFTTKKPMETKSMRVKRSTTSFTQELMNNSMSEQYEIKRSNTLSKVKRFGSMLVRGNSNSSRPNMPTFSSRPPTIDTKGLSNVSFSSTSSSSSDSEDEENLMTPVDSVSPEVISNKQQFLPLVFPKVSTVTKDDGFYLSNNNESFEYTPMDRHDDPLKLNLALLVQHELSDAFEEADQEFEADLEMSRRAMLQSIQSR